MIALALSSAHAGSLPTEIGACTETLIKEVTTRLGTPDSGTVVQYASDRFRFLTGRSRRPRDPRPVTKWMCAWSACLRTARPAMIAAKSTRRPISAPMRAGKLRTPNIAAAEP